MKTYNTKPIAREEKYVDFEAEVGMWGIFGVDSGFCYATFADETSANEKLEKSS